MTCHICETIERDLNDVARTLDRRTAAIFLSPTGNGDIDIEIRALSATKAEIEARYAKHRKSCYVVTSEGKSSVSHVG